MTADPLGTTYAIVLRGEIGDHFGVLFDGMHVTRSEGRSDPDGPRARSGPAARRHRTDAGARNRARVRQPIGRFPTPGGSAVSTTPDTIVLVHGFWVTPRSWEDWIAHYEAKGFRVVAPAYPGFEVEVEALNADPTPIEAADGPRRSSSTSSRWSASSTRRRSSWATRRAARSPRSCSTTASASRAWRSNSAPDRGREGRAAVPGQGDVPGAEEPGQPPQGRRAHLRAVEATRSPTPSPRSARASSTSATTSPRRADLLEQRAGQLRARAQDDI